MERAHVVAVPYPGRGHINPMLSLCGLLASRGLLVTFVVTDEWLRLLRVADPTPPHSLLRFRTIPNVVPLEKDRGSNLPAFLRAVLTRMEPPFEVLLDGLDPSPPTLLLTDLYMPWPSRVAARRGIPMAALWTQSTAGLVASLHLQERLSEGEPIVSLENGRLEFIPRYDGSTSLADEINTVDVVRVITESLGWIRDPAHTLLLTSFQELEPESTNELRRTLPCKVYPIGPSIPYTVAGDAGDHRPWLDAQPDSSVLYVSLGSFIPVTVAQMEEMAVALRSSQQRFLWVARAEASRLQELGGPRGLVVAWCDQLGVLRHPAVGGFLTHCGWNSIQEGVYAGKPMLGFPLLWDQDPNCKLVAERWRVGMRLRRGGRFVGREEIEEGVRRLMDPAEGGGLRRRAAELGEVCRKAVEEGGTSYENLLEFAEKAM